MSLDQREFRDALGAFATGVTVVTARDASGSPVGVTANSFSSVSLDPPLVLWSIARSSSSFDAFNAAKYFAIHILHSEQEDISNRFASRGDDKFADLDCTDSADGVPLLADYDVRFECSTEHLYEGGDHVIVVGRVHRMDSTNREPLAFYRGKYAKVVNG